jgi:hypothetical protein
MKNKQNGLLLLAVVVGITLWFNRKKTKAGDLILELDKGEFGSMPAPEQIETIMPVSTDPQSNQIKFVGPFQVQYGQAIAGKRQPIGSRYTI